MIFPLTGEEEVYDDKPFEIVVFEDYETGNLVWRYKDSIKFIQGAFVAVAIATLGTSKIWAQIKETLYLDEGYILEPGDFISTLTKGEIVHNNELVERLMSKH